VSEPNHWAIVTGEYPPQPGGVADYTRLVAAGLAGAGDDVHVFAPASGELPTDAGVSVHRLPGRWGPTAVALLGRALDRLPRPRRLLVQYVPHAFGYKAMNLPLCAWLHSRRREPIDVMFHEVAFPWGSSWPWRHRLLGAVTRLMALLLARRADRAFVSIPAWGDMLRRLSPRSSPHWLPVPSTIPTRADPAVVADLRGRLLPDGGALIGHFGTYGALIAPLVSNVVSRLLAGIPTGVLLLIGRRGDRFAAEFVKARPEFAGRLVAPGELDPDLTAIHLAACDLLVQPYPDGVSSRRTSVMAGLALSVPVATTSGALTEPMWLSERAVLLAPADRPDELADAAVTLLAGRTQTAELALRGRELYRHCFALERTIATLRGTAQCSAR
jgi:glycosyltransferase involved in cell wall biosynthesis